MQRLTIYLALVQGVYFALTGIWPLVCIRTFMRVTGPKVDIWLVRTVGVLVLIIGCAIGLAGWRQNVTAEVALLAAGSAGGLMAIDVIYVLLRVISKIYLLDAVVE